MPFHKEEAMILSRISERIWKSKYIKSGSCRVVIVLAPFIVIKFARISFVRLARKVWQMIKWTITGEIKSEFWYIKGEFIQAYWIFLQGYCENWGEFIFYWKMRDRLLAPTYLSAFGLVNVARFTPDIQCGPEGFQSQVRTIAGEVIKEDAHHFFDFGNFGQRNGKVKIRDYGSKRTQSVILNIGNELFNRFDPRKEK
jgi:hypothetical protein